VTRAAAYAVLALLASAAAVSADVVRQDFGYGMTLETDGQAAVYQVLLPLVIYQHTVRPDLGDIRVINGNGEIVPYALRRAPGEERAPGTANPLRMFPLRGTSVEPSEALKLGLQAGSASVEIERPKVGETAPPSALTAVSAEPAATDIEVKRLSLTAPGVAVEGHAGEYLIDLGAHVPIDRINLDLPELNTVATADFEARDEPAQPWNPIAHATLYRLRARDGSELKNPPVRITLSSARYWRVRVAHDGGGLGHGNPSFVGGWLPDELVFAARGSAPFELLFGNGGAIPAAVRISTLTSPVPGADAGNPPLVIRSASLSAESLIGGPERLKPPRAERNWRVVLLWTVLLMGVGLLGWMASRLLRELSGGTTSHEQE